MLEKFVLVASEPYTCIGWSIYSSVILRQRLNFTLPQVLLWLLGTFAPYLHKAVQHCMVCRWWAEKLLTKLLKKWEGITHLLTSRHQSVFRHLSVHFSRFCTGIKAVHSIAKSEMRSFRAKPIAWVSGLHCAFVLSWNQESWNSVLVIRCFLWGHQMGQPVCQTQRGPETDLRQ